MVPPTVTESSLTFTRRRAAAAFLCVALGLVAARYGPWVASWVWLAGAFVLAGLAMVVRGWALRGAMCASVVLLAGGWFTVRVLEPRADSLARVGEGLVTLEGVVRVGPREVRRPTTGLARFAPPTAKWRLEFEAQRVETATGWMEVSGLVWVRVAGEEAPPVRAGDAVRITGNFETLDGPTNPGEDDIRMVAAQRGVVGTLSLTSRDLIVPLGGGSVIARAHEGLRARASGALDAALAGVGDAERALVRALILGEFDADQRGVREAFARQGLAHALSISGFHLAVMAAFALFVVRLTGDRGWVEPVIVAGLVLAYAAVVPASSPIVRSAAMVLVLLLAEACGRRYDRVTLVMWVGIALLVWRPLDLWSLGYQLSVGLTWVLLWLGGRFDAVLWREEVKGLIAPKEPGAWRAVKGHVRMTVSAGVLCWVVGTPVVMHAIGVVSPLAVVATVLVTPLIVMMLWVGYVGVVVGACGVGGSVGPVLGWLSRGAIGVVEWMDGLAWSSVRVPVTSGWWAIAATVGAVCFVRWGSVRKARWWVIGAALLAWLGAEWSFAGRLSQGVVVRVDMLDVGDGSCYLVRSGREAMLWDVGGRGEAGLVPEVVRACRALGVSEVPTVVVTHPDLDHFAGVEGVMRPLGVRRLVVPARFVEQAHVAGTAASVAADVMQAAGAEVVVVRAGDAWVMGSVGLEVLSPPEGAAWALDNDHSVVVMMRGVTEGGERRVLMTGDIQDAAIGHVRGVIGSVGGNVDVMELPHHGSARAAAMEFVRWADPGVVLQSTGPSRVGDVRWAGVRQGRVWLSTAERGWAWAEVMRDGGVRYGVRGE